MRTAIASPLCETIRAAFNRTDYSELRRLSLVEEDERCVRMEGTVPTHYLKQLANAIGLVTPGVLRIDNHIQIG